MILDLEPITNVELEIKNAQFGGVYEIYHYISSNLRTSSSLLNIIVKLGGFTKEMAMQVPVFQIFIDEDLQPNQSLV